MAHYDAKTSENKCPFCEIANGRLETPGVFWQDDKFMAFLSIDPNTEGFSCVIPKNHFGSDVLKMPDTDLQNLIVASKKVAQVLENYYSDVGRVGLIMEGTGIDHAHVKLVPFHGTEDLKHGGWKQYLSDTHNEVFFDKYEGWISSVGGPKADFGQLKELAQKIQESQEK